MNLTENKYEYREVAKKDADKYVDSINLIVHPRRVVRSAYINGFVAGFKYKKPAPEFAPQVSEPTLSPEEKLLDRFNEAHPGIIENNGITISPAFAQPKRTFSPLMEKYAELKSALCDADFYETTHYPKTDRAWLMAKAKASAILTEIQSLLWKP